MIGDVQVSTTFCTGGDSDADSHGCAAFTRDRRGQALVAYRVPEGSDAPDAFAEDAGKLQFARSDGYSAYMEATYPEPGMHWTGYVSEPHSFDAGYRNAFTVSPRLTLPGAGTPFAGPFRYQVVGGYRTLAGPEEDGSAPVDCAAEGGLTDCVSSGAPGADSAQPVRDLAVTPAPGQPEVAPGGRVRVPFADDVRGSGRQRGSLRPFGFDQPRRRTRGSARGGVRARCRLRYAGRGRRDGPGRRRARRLSRGADGRGTGGGRHGDPQGRCRCGWWGGAERHGDVPRRLARRRGCR